MKVLVLNCGSSSIKYQVLAMPEARVLARGLVQRIGEADGELRHDGERGVSTVSGHIADHGEGLRLVLRALTEGDTAVLADVSEIGAVGHRVVHGAERFSDTVRIDEEKMIAVDTFALATG